jgi:hypothetical protein
MKTSVRWVLFEYKGLELVILSKPFKTKESGPSVTGLASIAGHASLQIQPKLNRTVVLLRKACNRLGFRVRNVQHCEQLGNL